MQVIFVLSAMNKNQLDKNPNCPHKNDHWTSGDPSPITGEVIEKKTRQRYDVDKGKPLPPANTKDPVFVPLKPKTPKKGGK